MIICLILILIDLTITYFGVKHLGMIEGSFLIGSAGLVPGIMVVLVLFSFIAFVLWVLRKSAVARSASIAGLVLMCAVELVVIIHNLSIIYS